MLLRPSIYVYDMFLRTVLRFIHLANRLEIVAKNAYLVKYINFKLGLIETIKRIIQNSFIFLFSTEWMNETHPTHP